MGLPTTCKAAALVERGKPMEIIDVQVPDHLEPGSVLVETLVATVCGSDVHKWDGSSGGNVPLPGPVILGHEMTGRVVRLGAGVTHDSVGQPLSEGDRIVWAHGFCGQCVPCVVEHEPTLCDNQRLYMATPCTEYPYLTGGFAEYCYVFPTAGRVKVPDTVSDAAASASACAFRTIIHAYDRLGRVDERQAVLIQGAGPLGLFSTAMAVHSGASNVIVVGAPPARLDIARRWGAHHTIDLGDLPDAGDRREQVLALTGGRGADVVIEVSGALAAFNEGMGLLRSGGRYLVVGQNHTEPVPFLPSLIMTKQATLIGTRGASIEHYHRALQFMDRHAVRFSWEDMISDRFPLTGINDALVGMQSWSQIKPAIELAGARR